MGENVIRLLMGLVKNFILEDSKNSVVYSMKREAIKVIILGVLTL